MNKTYFFLPPIDRLQQIAHIGCAIQLDGKTFYQLNSINLMASIDAIKASIDMLLKAFEYSEYTTEKPMPNCELRSTIAEVKQDIKKHYSYWYE